MEDEKKSPGREPERLKINSPSWENAVRQALRAPIPPGGIPDRDAQKRAPGAGRPRKK